MPLTIYIPGQPVGSRPASVNRPSFKIEKLEVSATDKDFVLACSSMDDAEVFIDIDPMMNTYEDYFYGLTADSHTAFSIVAKESDPFEGRMGRRGGEATTVKIKCEPNGASGVLVAHLCFILENEPDFSKFYKIICKLDGAEEDDDATRDPSASA